MLVALVAAAMSSIDSVLLVMASTCHRDIMSRWLGDHSDRAAIRATAVYVASSPRHHDHRAEPAGGIVTLSAFLRQRLRRLFLSTDDPRPVLATGQWRGGADPLVIGFVTLLAWKPLGLGTGSTRSSRRSSCRRCAMSGSRSSARPTGRGRSRRSSARRAGGPKRPRSPDLSATAAPRRRRAIRLIASCEQPLDLRLRDLPHRVSRKGRRRSGPRAEACTARAVLRPRPAVISPFRTRPLPQDERGRHPLAPLLVLQAHDRALGDRGVGSQHLLDLERRDLVAARLEDVDAAPPEDPVVAVSTTATSPVRNQPSRKASRVASGRRQYSEEDGRPADLDLARSRPARLGRPASSTSRTSTPGAACRRARASLPVERVRERHPDLGHPVALEQRVPADLPPSLEHDTGSAADPETIRRQWRHPSDIRTAALGVRSTPRPRSACCRPSARP
jgi:hypothetical protein